ncbi:MAG: cupin domain-containing protein [Candidatus Puniceispirillaceae bacterium]
MSSPLWKGQAFSISHADGSGTTESHFEGGLRAFFEYRDLGIAAATGGSYVAHVIRAVPGRHAEPTWHVHDLDFQMVYILQGWVVFEYEGQGKVTLRPGTCVLQPPGIRHREVRHSDDLELIEICSPAKFETTLTDAPD